MGNCLSSKCSSKRPDKRYTFQLSRICCSKKSKNLKNKQIKTENSEGNRDETREIVKVPHEVVVGPRDGNEGMENISLAGNNKEKTERKIDDDNLESLDDGMKGNRDETRESVKVPHEVVVGPRDGMSSNLRML